ncbi:fungal-specific transcription factor domain-containing protein [Desarmillaria tabescens]|uniref:Fungal-specific transcription factor domain-containing protein n=1 Tax=Armillaria tabescens TaxID=1929756 RepID=A0AA39JG22_ARMTA|nr:fungal-specific transcription factor domain-containing protein [Desarmillaria tabescens]KAK0441749.1 fungal-specific transcription factor domain-containing protein [Desarmillaria tabescens]
MFDYNSFREVPSAKKRLAGACDRCRQKKVKCHRATAQENNCSNCVASNTKCTHTDLIKRRGSMPSYTQDSLATASSSKRHGPHLRYVHSLERRVNQLECMLKELNPNVHQSEEMAGRETSPERPPISMCAPTSRQVSQSSEITESEDFSHPDIMKSLKRLAPHHFESFSQRYFGRSSTFSLLTDAIYIKKKSTGDENMIQFREHFDLQPWERATADAETPRYVYPDNDLIQSLVAIYFETINPVVPVLHRPTFEKQVDEGLHLRDHDFGAALLLVLAVASRYSDDPRVLANPSSKLSSGWRFFEQVHIYKKAGYDPPCLYELQVAVLGAVYALGTSVPELSWTMIGVGLRSAIAIGLHRRKTGGCKFTVDDELKKRSFWVLVVLDRLLGLYVGYPAMIQDEELDLEMPVECDDDYWEVAPDGQVRFNQPSDEPSQISYINAVIRLTEIMSVVMKTLCSIKKARAMSGLTGKSWEQRLVAELDSSLNAWVDSIPDHLRWDPKRENGLFLYQSASLYSIYYMVQILIHCPFLRKDSSLSVPSLIICTNAARACTRIIEVHMTRIRTVNPQIVMGAFTSGTVFAMNIWSVKRAGHALNAKDLAGFELCLAALENAAHTWNIKGGVLLLFKALTFVESSKTLHDSTVPPTRLYENVAVAPAASIWSPYDAMPQNALPQSIQPFCTFVLFCPFDYQLTRPDFLGEQVYSENNLANQLGAGLPFGWAHEPFLGFSSSVQPLYLNMESEFSREPTIDTWTDAPLGFSLSEWNAFVTGMEPEASEWPS